MNILVSVKICVHCQLLIVEFYYKVPIFDFIFLYLIN